MPHNHNVARAPLHVHTPDGEDRPATYAERRAWARAYVRQKAAEKRYARTHREQRNAARRARYARKKAEAQRAADIAALAQQKRDEEAAKLAEIHRDPPRLTFRDVTGY